MNQTIGQRYGPAMSIKTQEDADAYLKRLVNDCVERTAMGRREAESVEKSNIAYYAGYYGDETRERVERLFGCTHPVFGSIAKNGPPSTLDAFNAGIRMAQAKGDGEWRSNKGNKDEEEVERFSNKGNKTPTRRRPGAPSPIKTSMAKTSRRKSPRSPTTSSKKGATNTVATSRTGSKRKRSS